MRLFSAKSKTGEFLSQSVFRAKLCAWKTSIDSSIQAQESGEVMRRKWRSYGNSYIIEYARSLALNPINYYTCFISYSSKDEDFAKRLYSHLQRNRVRCWFAPHDLRIGDRFADRIEESIRTYDKLLIVLSENSIRSTWVEDECRAALEKENRFREEQKLDKTVLFPIKLDESIKEATSQWVCKIRRERQIGDFTKWKNYADYRQAFEHLLRDLKSGA